MTRHRSAVTGQFASAEAAAADPERHVAEKVVARGAVHWAVTPAGLSIYRGGALLEIIPAAQFGELIYALASVTRGQHDAQS